MAQDEELRKRLMNTDQIERILWDVVDLYLIPRFRELGLNASGEWIDSLHVRENVIRGRKYTEQLEYGRRPYPMQPESWPPINPLREWVKIKLGLSGEQAERAAWAIRHKIGMEGTEIYREGGTDLMEILESDEVIDYVNQAIGAWIRAEVELFVSQQIKANFKD